MTIRAVRVNETQRIAEGIGLAGGNQPSLRESVSGDVIEVNLGSSRRALLEELAQQDDDDKTEIVSVYMTQADERVRPEHAALHGTVWDVDDPERPIPPLGHGCRCYLEYQTRSKEASERLGIPQVQEEPESGKEAMELMWKDGDVKPQETLGKTKGDLVEKGEIDPEQLIDDKGEAIPATLALAIARLGGGRVAHRSIMIAYARIQGAGLTLRQVQTIVKNARTMKSGTWVNRLARALLDAQLGLVRTHAAAQNISREIAKVFKS